MTNTEKQKSNSRSILRETIDFYRTAPFGETIFLYGLLHIIFDLSDSKISIISLLSFIDLITGTMLAHRQFMLRKKLEKTLNRSGYSDKAFETTIPEWCARQTATVVTDRAGHLKAYQKLCGRNRNKMQLPFIPNF